MDQHYDYCEKHDTTWHTLTNGSNCPFCELERNKNSLLEEIRSVIKAAKDRINADRQKLQDYGYGGKKKEYVGHNRSVMILGEVLRDYTNHGRRGL